MSEELPEDVRRFVVEHINSVEQLEVLLLLSAQAGETWTAESVSQRLYTAPAAAAMRLDDLRQQGFLTSVDAPEKAFRYRHGEQDAIVARVAELYRERRVSIITLIYSKPHQQVQAFADAFKLRKQSEKE
jgi:hypothetical protein